MTRVAFLGTPALAIPILDAVGDAGEVAVAVTRPDAPRGRSRRPQPSPVRQAAIDRGIPTETPARAAEVGAALEAHGPLDVAVVAAYGMILRPDALSVPRRGCLNVHLSLLPRWRGAAPVQRALLAGDAVTGVSLMRLDPGLDTGPVTAMAATRIGEDETAGDLTTRLVAAGGQLVRELLRPWIDGRLVETSQPSTGATLAAKVEPEERRLDLTDDPDAFRRRVRALSPRPGAYALLDEQPFRVLRVRAAEGAAEPGELELAEGRVLCGVGSGRVELVEVQPAGKQAMPAEAWARGRQHGLGRLQ